jgi:5-formyltetrahydrofolate cyclo-ligase
MDWTEIKLWRREKRADIIAQRTALHHGERLALRPAIEGSIERLLPAVAGKTVGFYWPFRAEVDLKDFIRRLLKAGAAGAALPVVVEKNQAVEFWRWQPRMALARGIWDIPIPAERDPVTPDIALVPLVGFDAAGYRLGYGGGYYDRTLGSLAPKPFAIGVGYDLGRLATIHPQAHDIPMDAIATETGAWRVVDGKLLEA